MEEASQIRIQKGDFVLSSDPALLDIELIYKFLSEDAYWAEGMAFSELKETIENSLCFGLYAKGGRQIGFASVETDFSSFVYLTDIFILEEFRGQGLSQWLIETIIAHPKLQDIESWMLVTDAAQGLYEKFGFKSIPGSPKLMERLNPNSSKKAGADLP